MAIHSNARTSTNRCSNRRKTVRSASVETWMQLSQYAY
jgi:hypothetical protein